MSENEFLVFPEISDKEFSKFCEDLINELVFDYPEMKEYIQKRLDAWKLEHSIKIW